jgi:hypothetical protein
VGGIAISFQALALRAACSARMPVACAVCRGLSWAVLGCLGLSWAVLGCLGLSHERVGGNAGVTPAARYACLAVRLSRGTPVSRYARLGSTPGPELAMATTGAMRYAPDTPATNTTWQAIACSPDCGHDDCAGNHWSAATSQGYSAEQSIPRREARLISPWLSVAMTPGISPAPPAPAGLRPSPLPQSSAGYGRR